VVVAVVAVRVVQVALHQVIDVIAVRDRRVAAIRAVLVALVVVAAIVLGSAAGRVRRVDRQGVVFNFAAGLVVQVAVVQVIDVARLHWRRLGV